MQRWLTYGDTVAIQCALALMIGGLASGGWLGRRRRRGVEQHPGARRGLRPGRPLSHRAHLAPAGAVHPCDGSGARRAGVGWVAASPAS